MESVNLDMEDLFELESGTLVEEQEDYGAMTAPMPDLETDEMPMAEEQLSQEEGDADVLSKLKDIKKGAAKKRVMKPQPKLDSNRLIGDRGLPALVNLFKNVKFKGRGYEAEDLKLMMSKLEHWGHRLFPKMPFDELIERAEKLGAKGDVKTCVKRIRLDMPLVNNEYVEEPEVIDNQPEPQVEFDAEAAYDEMIRQEREALHRERQANAEDTVPSSDEEDLSAPRTPMTKKVPALSSPTHVETPATSVVLQAKPDTPAAAAHKPTQGLTPEQKQRLEMNKLNALKKKAARLGVPLESLLPPKPVEASTSAVECETAVSIIQCTTSGSIDSAVKPRDKDSSIASNKVANISLDGPNASVSTEDMDTDEKMADSSVKPKDKDSFIANKTLDKPNASVSTEEMDTDEKMADQSTEDKMPFTGVQNNDRDTSGNVNQTSDENTKSEDSHSGKRLKDMQTEEEILESLYGEEDLINAEDIESIEACGTSTKKQGSNEAEEDQSHREDDDGIMSSKDEGGEAETSSNYKDEKAGITKKNDDIHSNSKDVKNGKAVTSKKTDNGEATPSKPLLKVCAEPVLDSCVSGDSSGATGGEREQKGGSVGSDGRDVDPRGGSVGSDGRKGSGGEDLVLEFSDSTNTTQEEEDLLQSP